AGLNLVVAFISTLTTRAAEVTINLPVLLFTLAISVITGLAFGAIPAFTVKRDLVPALKTATGGSTPRMHGQATRSTLIVAQVALSFMMRIAAGLMIRSFIRLQQVDAGYNATNVLTMNLPLNWTKYQDLEKLRIYQEALLQRAGSLPGVVSAGITSGVPLDNSQPNQNSIEIEGHPIPPGTIGPTPAFMQRSTDAFQTLGIPLVTGRTFTGADRNDTMQVAVISQSMAKHYWEGQDPVGRRISFDRGQRWITIVGTVGDVKEYGLDHPAADTIYRPISQNPGGRSLSVRTTAAPMMMTRLVTRAIRE